MKLIDFSTSRRVTVAMLMVAVIAFGLVGFDRLAVNLLPDITYPTITIRTEYSGVAPAEIERLVAEPIEGLVGVVNSVIRVSSVSRPGLGDVIVEFAWGTDMDFASLDIREKLDLVQLPVDAGKPVLLRYDPALDPIMRVALHGGGNLMELRRLCEDRLRLDLESLKGVAAVRVEGGLEEEIQVELETMRLADLGIPISDVTSRLAAENVNLTGGLLKDGEAEFMVRTLNEFRNVAEIGEIVVGQVGAASLKLNDVGRVVRGHRERDVIARINGAEGVEVAIFKEGDANTVQVSAGVQQRLAEFEESNEALLGGAQVEVVFDQAKFIRQAVEEVLNTAAIGGALAIVILYMFLRNLSSTVIISLSIPISVVATFFLMYGADVSLNIMSLGGLALGVGMLVDNSIVVLESVQRYLDRGMGVLEAARRGSSEVGRAVVAATITTVCVFLPIVFVEGVAGQLFKDQALTVTFSLVTSLLVALMLIPMLSSLSLQRGGPSLARSGAADHAVRWPAAVLRGAGKVFAAIGTVLRLLFGPLLWGFDRLYAGLSRVYPRFLQWCLVHRPTVLLVAVVVAAGVLYRAQSMGLDLIPEMSQGEFLVDLEWPAGTPLEATAVRVAAIDNQVRQLEGVATVFGTVGASGESGGYADEKKEHMAQLQVRLQEPFDAGDENALMERVRRILMEVPDLEHKFARPSYFSFRTPVEVEVYGYNSQTLRSLSETVAERLAGIEGLVDIRSTAAGGQPEVQALFDRIRVAEIGTTVQAIGNLLRNKVQGDVATELTRQDRKIDIRVRAVEPERRNLDDLRQMTVSPPAYPVAVPLESVASLKVVEGPAEIRRIDQERVAVVGANLDGRGLGSVVEDIEAALAELAVPEGFSIDIGGQNEEMVRSFDSMKFALLLAVFLVYLVMASQFESLLHPLVIMCTIPLGLVGSALALLLTGQTVSVVVLIGLIMLAGVVVNNAIVLVDYVNHLRRQEGVAKMEALVQAGSVRFRPILMTTSTTVLALLPMALGLGEGAEVRAPMAITVIGGLLLSTVLTLGGYPGSLQPAGQGGITVKIAEFSVARPVTVAMTTLSLLVLGVVSLKRLPLEQLPSISSSGIRVNATYRNTAPEEVERLITLPLEEVLATLKNIDSISSSSSQDRASVRVDFKAGTNMDLANMEVRERIDQVSGLLPEDLDRLQIWRWQSDQRATVYASVAWRGQGDRLFDIVGKVVEPRLLRLEGVANVSVEGIDEKQLIVHLDRERLDNHQVAIPSLGWQLRNNNVNVSLGRVMDGGRRYQVRAMGEFTAVDQIGKLPLVNRRLRLEDVSDVVYDYPEKKRYERLNGTDAVTVEVFKKPTANVVDVAAEIGRTLAEIESEYDGQLEVEVVRDRAAAVLREVDNLKTAAVMGAFLAIGIIFAFLRNIRSTLVIAVSIPTAALCVFSGMYAARELFGSTVTLNMVSMMGLMLAVGMLVDPAVVVLESIFRKREEGSGPVEAALRGSKEVGMAVVASSSTTMCVFIPFFFLSDSRMTTWLRDAGLSICLAIAVSMIVSLSIIPLATSRLFKSEYRRFDPWLKWLTVAAVFATGCWAVFDSGLAATQAWLSHWFSRIGETVTGMEWTTSLGLAAALFAVAVVWRRFHRFGMRETYVGVLNWTLSHRPLTLLCTLSLLGAGRLPVPADRTAWDAANAGAPGGHNRGDRQELRPRTDPVDLRGTRTGHPFGQGKPGRRVADHKFPAAGRPHHRAPGGCRRRAPDHDAGIQCHQGTPAGESRRHLQGGPHPQLVRTHHGGGGRTAGTRRGSPVRSGRGGCRPAGADSGCEGCRQQS